MFTILKPKLYLVFQITLWFDLLSLVRMVELGWITVIILGRDYLSSMSSLPVRSYGVENGVLEMLLKLHWRNPLVQKLKDFLGNSQQEPIRRFELAWSIKQAME